MRNTVLMGPDVEPVSGGASGPASACASACTSGAASTTASVLASTAASGPASPPLPPGLQLCGCAAPARKRADSDANDITKDRLAMMGAEPTRSVPGQEDVAGRRARSSRTRLQPAALAPMRLLNP